MPIYRRLGLGERLIQAGLIAADEIGARAYVAASQLGRPTYRKCGFKEVDEILSDMESRGVEIETCMVREPSTY